MTISTNPESYTITQDLDTGVWIVFQDISGHGKQVVALAEHEVEAGQKIEELIAGTLLPLFYSSEEFE